MQRTASRIRNSVVKTEKTLRAPSFSNPTGCSLPLPRWERHACERHSTPPRRARAVSSFIRAERQDLVDARSLRSYQSGTRLLSLAARSTHAPPHERNATPAAAVGFRTRTQCVHTELIKGTGDEKHARRGGQSLLLRTHVHTRRRRMRPASVALRRMRHRYRHVCRRKLRAHVDTGSYGQGDSGTGRLQGRPSEPGEGRTPEGHARRREREPGVTAAPVTGSVQRDASVLVEPWRGSLQSAVLKSAAGVRRFVRSPQRRSARYQSVHALRPHLRWDPPVAASCAAHDGWNVVARIGHVVYTSPVSLTDANENG
ncbi:hypothetical protein HPB50_013226 [Hyalomma asiaticum]|uniref:Uncharacterized protein n=1 Tax=Hyalomma asiaticum TaxID=266040 RepID=A0ACB7TJ98_HYAAI|nr:hypothetical protein HPB50_013226 [Hyalomma asiaticum]